MDKPYIDRLRKKAREERDKRKAAAMEVVEAEYQADLRSIDRLANLMAEAGGIETPPAGKPVNGNGDSLPPSRVGPAEATREAIASMGGRSFTIRDLTQFAQLRHPHVSKMGISSALSKMVGKRVECVRESAGREPGVYRSLAAEAGHERQPGVVLPGLGADRRASGSVR